jgi:hypothetical protein
MQRLDVSTGSTRRLSQERRTRNVPKVCVMEDGHSSKPSGRLERCGCNVNQTSDFFAQHPACSPQPGRRHFYPIINQQSGSWLPEF